MNEKFWYRIFVLCIFVILLGVGSIVGYKMIKNNSNIKDYTFNEDDNINGTGSKEAIDIYNDDDVESVSTKTYDIEVVYTDLYTLCNEEVTTSKIFYGVKLDDIKNQEFEKQERENNVYNIVKETNEKVVFKKVIDAYCPNHYKIILENEKINIYRKVSNEKYEIYKVLDIPVETLRVEVINELIGGVLANSKEELNMIIEDIES